MGMFANLGTPQNILDLAEKMDTTDIFIEFKIIRDS